MESELGGEGMNANEAFHELWWNAKGLPGYDKKKWIFVHLYIESLERAAKGMKPPATQDQAK